MDAARRLDQPRRSRRLRQVAAVNPPSSQRERSQQIRRIALPARGRLGRARRQFLAVLRKLGIGRALPVRRVGQERAAHPDPRAHQRRLAHLSARPQARASSTAIGCMGPTSRTPACASIPISCCSIPTPRPSAAHLQWADELFGYQLGDPDGDLSFDDRDSAPFAPLGAVIDPSFDWSGEQRPRMPPHETIIYEAHVRGMTDAAPGRAGGAARHLCGHGLRAHHRASARARRHGDRADAGALLPGRPASGRQGPAQLLGLQHARLLRAGAELRRAILERRPTWCASSSRWSRICTTPASR